MTASEDNEASVGRYAGSRPRGAKAATSNQRKTAAASRIGLNRPT